MDWQDIATNALARETRLRQRLDSALDVISTQRITIGNQRTFIQDTGLNDAYEHWLENADTPAAAEASTQGS